MTVALTANAQAAEYQVIGTGGTLHVRTAPSLSAPIVGNLGDGTAINILCQTRGAKSSAQQCGTKSTHRWSATSRTGTAQPPSSTTRARDYPNASRPTPRGNRNRTLSRHPNLNPRPSHSRRPRRPSRVWRNRITDRGRSRRGLRTRGTSALIGADTARRSCPLSHTEARPLRYGPGGLLRSPEPRSDSQWRSSARRDRLLEPLQQPCRARWHQSRQRVGDLHIWERPTRFAQETGQQEELPVLDLSRSCVLVLGGVDALARGGRQDLLVE